MGYNCLVYFAIVLLFVEIFRLMELFITIFVDCIRGIYRFSRAR